VQKTGRIDDVVISQRGSINLCVLEQYLKRIYLKKQGVLVLSKK
jgi:hypothetical protein